MSEKRFEGELEEPGDRLSDQREDEEEAERKDEPSEGEPWAKTSSGDKD
jgi:hypothetical protein